MVERSWPFGDLSPYAFDVVHADPPWPWATYSEKGAGKSPTAQYRTMTMGDIATLPVGDLLAPGGALFLWCTWPLIEAQTQLPRGWGLEVKTGGAWIKRTESGKLRCGTGYLMRSVCEPFVIAALRGHGVRGAAEPNLIETIGEMGGVDGVAREHSRKPVEIYELIERLTPGARRCDLFGRQSRPGWSVWGNEATKFDGDAA